MANMLTVVVLSIFVVLISFNSSAQGASRFLLNSNREPPLQPQENPTFPWPQFPKYFTIAEAPSLPKPEAPPKTRCSKSEAAQKSKFPPKPNEHKSPKLAFPPSHEVPLFPKPQPPPLHQMWPFPMPKWPMPSFHQRKTLPKRALPPLPQVPDLPVFELSPQAEKLAPPNHKLESQPKLEGHLRQHKPAFAPKSEDKTLPNANSNPNPSLPPQPEMQPKFEEPAMQPMPYHEIQPKKAEGPIPPRD
ncbi:hypothetical protein HPP92_012741 [Vanilla planifolia]|uniref:Uncharacterized protein n=1 Tax=Vanilla planifolia TaxID=51239 RepID=A0A835R0K5_VANPL|nr:hypothetical protein HPP92_012741 [Vanilla planifolia]